MVNKREGWADKNLGDHTPGQQPHLSLEELQQWQSSIEEANRHNILCHCRQCDREWIASTHIPCECGSRNVEYIACWQFPDD